MYDYPPPAVWSRADAQSSARRDALRALQRENSLDARHRARASTPRAAVDELARLVCRAIPQALLLAGGTDVGLWVTKHLRSLPTLIYVGNVAELLRRCARPTACSRSAQPSA